MNGAGDDDNPGPRVYIPAAFWRSLLERLATANVKLAEPDLAGAEASEDAARAVTEFLEAIPAVRESGITRPLQDLLAALPGLVRVADRTNNLLVELAEAATDRDATILEKGGTQLGMLVRFVEDATGGEIGATLQPARELFEALHDRAQGDRPSLLWEAPHKPSRNRAHHITRAYLAAAVDVLHSAGMTDRAIGEWWGRPEEYKRAAKWRERISRREASPLTIHVFRELRPHRKPISEPDAKAKALEWRKIARQRKTDKA
jgi:hypothetical protein